MPVSSAPNPDPNAAAGPLPTAARKKRWTSRSKTGCLTCRARRVKCGEESPACRRCVALHYHCRYENRDQIVVSSARSGPAPPVPELRIQQQSRISIEAEPPGWDFMQAVRYYFSVVQPARTSENGKALIPNFDPSRATFYICAALHIQLAAMSKSRGRLLRFGEDQGLATFWENYARYLSEVIGRVNRYIEDADGTGNPAAFTYMYTLIASSMNLDSGLWLAHINACFAFVQYLGGIKSITEPLLKPYTPFFRLVSKVVMFNTTIPATKQILGCANYTDHQLRIILDNEFDADVPCPSDVRIVLIHITRLRYQVATLTFVPGLATTIDGIFEDLEGADIIGWAETNRKLGGTTIETVGQIFHDAAKLHAILALPRPAMGAWARAHTTPPPGDADVSPYDHLRLSQRSKLLTLLKENYPIIQYPLSLRWPLVVAGAALGADGAEVDRAFVDDCLFTLWRNPLGDGSLFLCLQKLRDFWYSGKSGWEDCFNEPVPG